MSACRDWMAWQDRMPGHTPVLHVMANCTVVGSGLGVELRPLAQPERRAGRPWIAGPLWLSRQAGPPHFQIDPEPNRFYAVEIATAPQLLDSVGHGTERSLTNFYASWNDPQATFRLSAPSYTLPASAWAVLRQAERLYYRVGSTSNPPGWDNYITSTADDEATSAPCTVITASDLVIPLPDATQRLLQIVTNSGESGNSGSVQMQLHYKEQTEDQIERVIILPDCITIEVERVD